jgi:hypothetical protein
LTGALSGTSATFSGDFTLANPSTNTKLFINRASSAYTDGIFYQTNGTSDFLIGQNPLSTGTSDLSIYSYGTSSVVFNIARSTGAATFSSSVGIGGTISGNYPLTIRSGVADYTKILDWGTGAGGSWGTMTINTSAPYNTIFNSGGFAFTGGNVGIGTISPSANLHVKATSGSAIFRIEDGGGNAVGRIQANAGDGSINFFEQSGYALTFGTSNIERMRITSGGDLLVGKTSTATNENGLQIYKAANGSGRINIVKTSTGTNSAIANYHNGTYVGGVDYSDTSTSFPTSSDYRLKQDFKDFSGLDLVSAIKTYDYEWKADNTRAYGVIAHEFAEVLPYAVHGEKDGEQMQGVDYSKIVPILVKAIQELEARVKQLENK